MANIAILFDSWKREDKEDKGEKGDKGDKAEVFHK
jgi:hypothetical protein